MNCCSHMQKLIRTLLFKANVPRGLGRALLCYKEVTWADSREILETLLWDLALSSSPVINCLFHIAAWLLLLVSPLFSSFFNKKMIFLQLACCFYFLLFSSNCQKKNYCSLLVAFSFPLLFKNQILKIFAAFHFLFQIKGKLYIAAYLLLLIV